MKQPSPIISILASGPVFFGSWVFACWLLYQWSLDGGIWPLIVVMGGLLLAVMKADERMKAYKAWKREWDAMNGQPTGLPRGMTTGIWLGIAGIVGCFALAGQPPETQNAVAVLGLLAAIGALGVYWLKRRTPRSRPAKTFAVAVCVTRPVFAVPTLQEAYRALPEHCLRLG